MVVVMMLYVLPFLLAACLACGLTLRQGATRPQIVRHGATRHHFLTRH